jgi:diguanylate cyclase (GGDEF)-like protein
MLHRHLLVAATCVVAALLLFSARLIFLQQDLEQEHESLSARHTKMRELATTDSLTGLANRRCFLEALESAIARVRADGEYFVLALLDIDKLKQINDHQGHLAGDECLCDLANTLNSVLEPPFENFARFSGDEFVLLLPFTSIEESRTSLEQVRTALAGTQVRFSFGLRECSQQTPAEVTELLAEADEDLYRDKRVRS